MSCRLCSPKLIVFIIILMHKYYWEYFMFSFGWINSEELFSAFICRNIDIHSKSSNKLWYIFWPSQFHFTNIHSGSCKIENNMDINKMNTFHSKHHVHSTCFCWIVLHISYQSIPRTWCKLSWLSWQRLNLIAPWENDNRTLLLVHAARLNQCD